VVLQALIEAEAAQQIGAGRYERTEARTTHRNGTRARLLSTKAGDVELRIPKLREGSFFPALLEPRRRIDRALLAVVMEAYVHGTSTRKVDDLVKALGVDSGISKSEVSRICAELDGEVAAFRSRSLAHTRFPVPVRGRHLPQGQGRRAGGLPRGGDRHRGHRRRRPGSPRPGCGRQRGRRVLDRLPAQPESPRAHRGAAGRLRRPHRAEAAIGAVMAGAAWQRCRVHFLRNVLARVPRGSAEMVAAAIRTIFAQPTGAEVGEQLGKVAAMLQPKFPAVARMLVDACEDLTAFTSFPVAHWAKLWSTNPLERVNKEVKRRTNVVGIFPDDAAVLRLAGAVLVEAHDEWQVAERRYLSEGSMAKLTQTSDDGRRPKEVKRATAELVAT
jgi:putative transposase